MREYAIPVFGTLFVALPITLFYGWIALLGASSITDIIQIWTDTHAYRDKIYMGEYERVFSGLCGLIGILGLWVGSLFYHRLAKKVTMFTWITIILLAFGTIGAIYQFVDMFMVSLEYDGMITSTILLYGPLLLVSCYAAFLIKRFLMPNKRLQIDAAKPRD